MTQQELRCMSDIESLEFQNVGILRHSAEIHTIYSSGYIWNMEVDSCNSFPVIKKRPGIR